MVKSLVKGEKVVIGKLHEGLNHFSIELKFENPFYPLLDIDIFAFTIDEKQRINKEDIVFYNHPILDKSIQYDEDYENKENKKTFEINLNKLPENIQKIVIGCAVYKDKNMGPIQKINLTFRIFDKITKMEMFEIHEEMDIENHETFLLGDIYQYKDLWKLNTVVYPHEKNILSSIKGLYGVNFY